MQWAQPGPGCLDLDLGADPEPGCQAGLGLGGTMELGASSELIGNNKARK